MLRQEIEFDVRLVVASYPSRSYAEVLYHALLLAQAVYLISRLALSPVEGGSVDPGLRQKSCSWLTSKPIPKMSTANLEVG